MGADEIRRRLRGKQREIVLGQHEPGLWNALARERLGEDRIGRETD